ncbi:hypothetical protein ACW4TU_33680 [Streptomyces sp. QTS52]
MNHEVARIAQGFDVPPAVAVNGDARRLGARYGENDIKGNRRQSMTVEMESAYDKL